MEKSRPSVRPCFLLLWGMGLHGNSEVSDVCLVWSQALGVLVHVSTSVLWRENGCIFVWMRCQDNCNWSALLKNFVFSVCLCKVCVLCVCVHVCVLVSCLFLRCSHRGASRNIFSPLWQHFPVERKRIFIHKYRAAISIKIMT